MRVLSLLTLTVCILIGVNLMGGLDLSSDAEIIWTIRFPRVVGCLAIGAALATAGLVFQSLLNNPLADGYILGLSSGASVGALLFLAFFPNQWGNPLGSLLGAMTSLALLLLFFRRVSGAKAQSWVTIWGICLTLFFTACTVFLLQWFEPTTYYQASRWFMGSLNNLEWADLLWPSPVILICLGFLLANHHRIVALSAGPVFTSNLGLSYKKTFSMALTLATLLTSGAVVIGGPIGFVGLVSPHIASHLGGPPKSFLHHLIRAALVGGAFLLLCDGISQFLFWKWSIPTGALTAAIGAPFLGFLVWKMQRP